MKIFAVGMNYPQHNKEVQNTLLQKTASADSSLDPIIFTKADSALLKDHKPFFLPDFMGQNLLILRPESRPTPGQ